MHVATGLGPGHDHEPDIRYAEVHIRPLQHQRLLPGLPPPAQSYQPTADLPVLTTALGGHAVNLSMTDTPMDMTIASRGE